MKWVVAYDVHCDSDRRKLARQLERVGFRRQFSVFEGELSVDALRQLMDELQSFVTGPRDVLTAWPWTENGAATVQHRGDDRSQTECDWMLI